MNEKQTTIYIDLLAKIENRYFRFLNQYPGMPSSAIARMAYYAGAIIMIQEAKNIDAPVKQALIETLGTVQRVSGLMMMNEMRSMFKEEFDVGF